MDASRPFRNLPPISGGSDGDEPVATPPVTDTPPAPQYVSRDDFDRMVADNAKRHEESMASMRSMFTEAIGAMRSAPPQAHASVDANAELSDAQLQQRVDEGQMTPIQAARYIADRANAKLAAE